MIDTEPVEISVVIPVYNEEENLPVLLPKLLEVLKGLHETYEVIFVDDGSSDGSGGVLREMATQYPSIRILKFKANRGLSAA
jgi:dolichol-phosphate mannosyltransferase